MQASLIDAASNTIRNLLLAGDAGVTEKEGIRSALHAGDCATNLINRSAEDAVLDVIRAGSTVNSAIFSEGSSGADVAGVVERVAGNAGDNELRAGEAGVGN